MKMILGTIAIGVVSHLAQSVGPWWIGAVVAAVVVILVQLKPGSSFLAGFIGVAIAWGVAAWWMDFQNHGILSTRIAELFGGIPQFGLIGITACLGGLTGGLGALSGSLGNEWVLKSAHRTGQQTAGDA